MLNESIFNLKFQLTCELCEFGAGEFITWFAAGDSPQTIVDKGVNLCLTLNVQTERVCRGVLDTNIVLNFHNYSNYMVY
jgi:hypothetical protein